jgi:hypothetical protein
LLARDSDARQIFGGFVDSHIITVDRAAKPHGMHVVISDHDGVVCMQFSFGNQPGDDFRRQKMSGHAEIRLHTLEQTDHRTSV